MSAQLDRAAASALQRSLVPSALPAVGGLEMAARYGAHPEDVAAALGLHRKTVYAWLAKYREGGKDALKAQPVPGRPPKLGGAQLLRLYALIAGQDPRQMQFEFALWTREMVREVIRREFGVALSVVSVGRLLRKLGMSPQRPLHRAYQQDPGAVERWKREEYPAIQAQAEAAGAVIYFADEAGIRSDYHAGTTWSPVGQTPHVPGTGHLGGGWYDVFCLPPGKISAVIDDVAGVGLQAPVIMGRIRSALRIRAGNDRSRLPSRHRAGLSRTSAHVW